GFWLSGGEGNDQANSDKCRNDNQHSIVHKTSYKLSPPASASKFITLCIGAVLQAMALCDGPNSVCTLVRTSLTTLHWNTRNTSTTCVNLSKRVFGFESKSVNRSAWDQSIVFWTAREIRALH